VIWAGSGVLAVLVLSLLVAQWRVHERALDAIIAGHEELPVPAIERAGRKLASPRRRRALARSLEQAAIDAGGWSSIEITVEVVQVARLLRSPEASHVRGVALTERLLSEGLVLPVGGSQRELLRRELGRIQFELRT
jgi:hypothetical protein